MIARCWSRFGRIRLAILDESGRLYCAMRGSSPCEVRDGLKVTTVLLGQASLVRRVHRPFIRRDPDRAVASRASQPGTPGSMRTQCRLLECTEKTDGSWPFTAVAGVSIRSVVG